LNQEVIERRQKLGTLMLTMLQNLFINKYIENITFGFQQLKREYISQVIIRILESFWQSSRRKKFREAFSILDEERFNTRNLDIALKTMKEFYHVIHHIFVNIISFRC
jgi:hypothetical protein